MKKKVLLMGKSGSGKTSMRSIIFANYIARDTKRLGATIDIEHNHVRFLGNLVLNLWDCGGQQSFMDNYLTTQQTQVFRNVEVLIYVFDVESRDFETDLQYYSKTINCLSQLSKARVFCLIHKMDLVPADKRSRVDQIQQRILEKSDGLQVKMFTTSIWDESLYQAWSSIVHSLIPNVEQLHDALERLRKVNEAKEVILFEKTTFLVIGHTRNDMGDVHRFEKLSNIIKQFKLSCSKTQAQFLEMEIKGGSLLVLKQLTMNTFILIVLDEKIQSMVPLLNLQQAKAYFEQLF